jgi:DNA-binding MarR family transcriptional regulator
MTRWLTHDEQVLWRSWLTAITLVPEVLGRDLQEAHGLTMADYDILVRLSESADHALRMSELAHKTLVSRSRLTHQIDRMERAGLVLRQVCEEDGRGLRAVMTDAGWQLLQIAAKDHVESVRRRLVDVLTPEEFQALGEASAKLVAALGATVEIPNP